MYSIGQFLKSFNDKLSVSDCNAITTSVIASRIIFAAILKSNECGAVPAEKVNNLTLLNLAERTFETFFYIFWEKKPTFFLFQKLRTAKRNFFSCFSSTVKCAY